MPPLPRPEWLTIQEAVDFVCELADVEPDQALEALVRACQDRNLVEDRMSAPEWFRHSWMAGGGPVRKTTGPWGYIDKSTIDAKRSSFGYRTNESKSKALDACEVRLSRRDIVQWLSLQGSLPGERELEASSTGLQHYQVVLNPKTSLPVLPEVAAGGDPSRLPRRTPMVGIRQAVTWLAFGELWDGDKIGYFDVTLRARVEKERRKLESSAPLTTQAERANVLSEWRAQLELIIDAIDEAKDQILEWVFANKLSVFAYDASGQVNVSEELRKRKVDISLIFDAFSDSEPTEFIPAPGASSREAQDAGGYLRDLREFCIPVTQLQSLISQSFEGDGEEHPSHESVAESSKGNEGHQQPRRQGRPSKLPLIIDAWERTGHTLAYIEASSDHYAMELANEGLEQLTQDGILPRERVSSRATIRRAKNEWRRRQLATKDQKDQ